MLGGAQLLLTQRIAVESTQLPGEALASRDTPWWRRADALASGWTGWSV
ncbi:MAG: hypothetical protein HY681_03310 [Chloroflexi bacterium]|nr:hypothetical protein [Chloroflexota bacterium]